MNAFVRTMSVVIVAGVIFTSVSALAVCPQISARYSCTDPGGRVYSLNMTSITNPGSEIVTYKIEFIHDIPVQPTIWAYTDGNSRMVMHGPDRSMNQTSTCSEKTVDVIQELRIDGVDRQFVVVTDFTFEFSADKSNLILDRVHSTDPGMPPRSSRDVCRIR
jgi:hypothetical protein